MPSMPEDAPSRLPAETPPGGARLYAWMFLAVSVIGLLTGGLERLALLPDAAAKACRAFYLCGPRPLNTLPPFEVVHGSGSTWEQVEKDDVPPEQRRLEAENPDFNIVWHRGEETGGCSGAFNTTCRYHYHGRWSAGPKWEAASKLPWIVLGCVFLVSLAVILRRRGARSA
jgi:hypothetical protein